MIGEMSNHLWQSTVFAILAGLLTLAFRKNRAQVRYWLWFSTSLKFLIPLETVLAHELCHIKRRDNLTAAIHMIVEAVFWFHPLVWWISARLMAERERACDEGVLELGSDRQVYAESILKTCEFCLESPLTCVSGVTGADLKKRIVRIMADGLANKLSFSKRVLLASIAIGAIAGPVLFGLVNAPQIRAQATQATGAPLPSFEVASIKPDRSPGLNHIWGILPGRFSTKNVTTRELIAYAYNVKDSQIEGGPTWISSEQYNIVAKPEDSDAEKLGKLPWEQYREEYGLLVQSLLADRFELKISHATKELPVYAMVVAKNGPKLMLTKGPPPGPGPKRGPWISTGRGQLTSKGMSLGELAGTLAEYPDLDNRKVLDQTGLKGNYDISLRWTPDQSPAAMFKGAEGNGTGTGDPASRDSSGPSIFTAIQEQLGLRLVSTKGPVDIIVIDHIERPSEN